jgi:hypothetical protein
MDMPEEFVGIKSFCEGNIIANVRRFGDGH